MGERDGTHANRTAITSLTVKAKEWATPTQDGNYNRKGASQTSADGLATQALSLLGRPAPRSGIGGPPSSPDGPTSPPRWATPNAADGTGGHHPSEVSAERGGNRTLNRNLQEMGYPLRLNPRFVEWLMNFPIGWTDFAPSATPSFLPKPPALS